MVVLLLRPDYCDSRAVAVEAQPNKKKNDARRFNHRRVKGATFTSTNTASRISLDS